MAIQGNVIDNDPYIRQSIREISSSTGDDVSVYNKQKSLIKFGRTTNADAATKTTVALFQGTEINETFATGNSIDYVVSSSGSDTEIVTVEGHTVDGSGNMTFVTQNVTLNGQTPVALTTPLYRSNRVFVPKQTYASPASALVGNIHVYDATVATGVTAGVPNVATATKIMIAAGKNQSEKCATSVSSTDYWIITEIFASVSRSSPVSAKADIDVEYKEVGGVWRPLGFEISLDQASGPFVHDEMRPHFWIPKNSDVRMVITSDTNDTKATGYIAGYLASVTS